MLNPPTASAVLVHHLMVRRGPSTVLDKLDLDVSIGEVIAIQGPSGSGKSTLLAAIAGLLSPEAGTIVVNEEALTGRSDRVRSAIRLQSIGIVFQHDELLPELTIAENVTLPMKLRKRSAMSEMTARLNPLLESLEIGPIRDRLPSQVSGGQLQRAAIARAMINEPAVILADEPTGSLDNAAARTAIELLVNMARQRHSAVVVVTHDPTIAAMCDRVLTLEDGRLVSSTAQIVD